MITVARYLGPNRAQVKLFLDLLNVPNIELSNKLYFDFTIEHIGQATKESIVDFARQLVGDPIPDTEFQLQPLCNCRHCLGGFNPWVTEAKKWDQQSV